MTRTPTSCSSLAPLLVKFGLFVTVAGMGVSSVVAQTAAKAKPADDSLALQVRQTLADHPTLKPHKLNLLVNVIDGVAVIGGPVPDDKLGAVIESVVSQIDGVARVKVSVWVMSLGQTDPLAARLEEKLNPRPTPPPAPAVTLSMPGDSPSRPEPRSDPRPTGSVTTRTQPAPSAAPPSILLPPVPSAERTSLAPHTSRPPGAEPPEYTPIPATNLPTEPIPEPRAASVRAAAPREVERATESEAWKRDPRFARLTVDVRNGTATIGGRARSHTAAWELAEEVRNWPAVDRVVVGRVEVNR